MTRFQRLAANPRALMIKARKHDPFFPAFLRYPVTRHIWWFARQIEHLSRGVPEMLRTSIASMTSPAIAMTLLVALAGCGDETPTSPRGAGNNNPPAVADVSVSVESIDYGVVCFGSDKTVSFKITANADNTEDVAGFVSIDRGTDDAYNIESGGGDYTLAPGEEKTIKVRFNPQRAFRTHTGEVSVFLDGTGDTLVPLTGYGSERPYLIFGPGSSGAPGYDTNYAPFVSSPPGVLVENNVDYEEPNWLRCNGSAWICNGNAVTESAIRFEVDVPDGTTKVTVLINGEIEDDCTQLLIEIDGSENRWENLAGRCQNIEKTLSISPGKHTIRVGTDQSSFCSGDLAIWEVRLTFNRPCITPDER